MAAYRAQPPRPPAPRLVVEALSRGLFLYLQTSVPKTLKWLYPSRPARADEFMQREIVRASADPGALKVFQSAFYLKPPPPLNYVLDKYGGPTLVLQGADDPLNDAAGRARDLERLCTRARATLLRGGHVSACIRPRREGAQRTDNRQSARTTRTQRSSPPSWSPSSSPRPRNRSRWRWRARRREGERYDTSNRGGSTGGFTCASPRGSAPCRGGTCTGAPAAPPRRPGQTRPGRRRSRARCTSGSPAAPRTGTGRCPG